MEKLIQATQEVAYFLWEYTKHDNALDLWYCAEDIAFYAERHNILRVEEIKELTNRERHDYGYLEFVRNISYRIYLFTGNSSSIYNWFTSEDIIRDSEWVRAIACMASIYRKIYKKELNVDSIRSLKIRRYYSE